MASLDGVYAVRVQSIQIRGKEYTIPRGGVSIEIRNDTLKVSIESWSFETDLEMLGRNSMDNLAIEIRPRSILGPAAANEEVKQALTAFLPTLNNVVPCGRGNLYLSALDTPNYFEITLKTQDAEDPKKELNRLLAQIGVQGVP